MYEKSFGKYTRDIAESLIVTLQNIQRKAEKN